MRYWREYPKFLQLILLLLLWYTLFYFSLLVGNFLVEKFYGVGLDSILSINENSSRRTVEAGIFYQSVRSLFIFTGTALIFAYLTHPKPLRYLGGRPVADNLHLIIIPLLMLPLIPLTVELGALIKLLPLGEDAAASNAKMETLFKTFLHMDSASDLVERLFAMALLPAVGEELLFRGVIMRFVYSSSRNIHVSILVAAFVFTLAHSQVYNFLPILLSGMLLGYIYYWTGSIWLNIWAHFVYNGVQIAMIYVSATRSGGQISSSPEHYPLPIIVISAVLFSVFIFLLKRKSTPLPRDWSNDYSQKELEDRLS